VGRVVLLSALAVADDAYAGHKISDTGYSSALVTCAARVGVGVQIVAKPAREKPAD
jgi:hypothetical protein